MTYQMFCKIDGIPGDSKDKKHKNWIEVLSYHHQISVTSSGKIKSRRGRLPPGVNHQDFFIVHRVDRSSPLLALASCKRKRLSHVILELCRATGNKAKFMTYVLTDAVVTTVEPRASVEEKEGMPKEQVSFSYGKIEWSYSTTDQNGKETENVSGQCDLT